MLLDQAERILDAKFDRRRQKSINTYKHRMNRDEAFQKRKLWVEDMIEREHIHFSNELKKRRL